MSKFWQVNEDPMYDDDGVLVDEDADWDNVQDPGDFEYDEDSDEWVSIEDLDPESLSYDPFNS